MLADDAVDGNAGIAVVIHGHLATNKSAACMASNLDDEHNKCGITARYFQICVSPSKK